VIANSGKSRPLIRHRTDRPRRTYPFWPLAEELFACSQPKSHCLPLGCRRQATDDYRLAAHASPDYHTVSATFAQSATSRWIGFGAGGLFILLGFSPKLSAVLSIMPTPVMGAIIVFVASFMIVSSLQIILSSKPDTRKTFVIGIPLIFGRSLQAVPELYAQVVPWLRPLFGSALTLATVLAVMLNLLLRIGDGKPNEASFNHE